VGSEAFLRLERLTKRFGKVTAVEDLTLSIARGSFTTLLGPSGCGKTTTLRLIAGFYRPDAGDIFIENERVTLLPPHRRETAMVFQSYALFPHMNVFDNVAYGLRARRMKKKEIQRRVHEALALVGLEGLERRTPGQLSGGQQQRVAVARALAISPRVLLMDEPLSNLDAKLRESVRKEIRNLQKHLEITTVYVTHDQEEALALSDVVVVMHQGKIQQKSSPWELYHRPANKFVADFVGIPNFLQAEILAISPNGTKLAVAGQQIQSADVVQESRTGELVLISIRPEGIRLEEDEPSEPSATMENVLKGRVIDFAFLGPKVRYWIDIGGQQLIAEEVDPEKIMRGWVRLRFSPKRTRIIEIGHDAR